MSFTSETDEAISLKAESIPANKLVGGSDDSTTPFTLPAVPVYFRSVDLRTTPETVRLENDKYRGMTDRQDET